VSYRVGDERFVVTTQDALVLCHDKDDCEDGNSGRGSALAVDASAES
jgi:hypothetical protein